MLIASILVNRIQVAKNVVRAHFQFQRCFLQSCSFNPTIMSNLVIPIGEPFHYKGKTSTVVNNIGTYSFESGKFPIMLSEHLQRRTLLTFEEDIRKHIRTRTNGNEKRKKWGRWMYSSLLALSLLGNKSEGEAERIESELILMIKRGILALKKGELNKAEQLLHVALKTAQESSNEQAVTYIFDLLANLAYQRDEYSKAEKLFKDVLRRILSGGMATDDNAVVEISLKLASVYASMQDYEKAVLGFHFCIGTQEEKINKYGEKNLDEDTLLLWAMSMDWYARFLLNIHKYDLAKQHFIKAYEMSVRVNGSEHEQTAVLLNDIGSVCSLQKEYTEAIQYFDMAISAARTSKSVDIGSFYVNLGTVYLQQTLLGEAERCCREGLLLSKKLENKESLEEAEICLSEIKKMKNSM